MSTNFRDIYVQHLEKQAMVSFVLKAARCWAGYEPVPGKAPYSEDSCRPKGSKKKDKKPAEKKSAAEKQAVNPVMKPAAGAKYSGPYSKTPFDIVHARQHLGLPDTASAHQAYNRMMYMHRNGKFTPAQFSAFNSFYGNHPPQFDDFSPKGEPHFEPATAPPPPARPAAPSPAMGALNKGANANVPVHPAGEPTKQIKPKPVKTTNSKQVVTGALTAGQKMAAGNAAAGASHFKHPKKELEPVVGGKKPSTENTKHHKVEPKLSSEGENLHPAASLLRPDAKPTSD